MALLVSISITSKAEMHRMLIHPFYARAQERCERSHSLGKAEEDALFHDVATANLAMFTRVVDNYVWATDAIPADGLDNYDLPGRTAVPVNATTYNGYGKPHWTGNFSLSYPINSINQINVTYLPFTPDNYTVTLTEGVDYLVHTCAKIELLTSLDVPIVNEHWVDGVNTSLLAWVGINYVASGIQSVFVDMNNGTARFGRNWGYAVPLPSEWWYDPDWPWEIMLWQLLDLCIDLPSDWPAGSEWWVNYTAASYLTVDYNACLPSSSPVADFTEYPKRPYVYETVYFDASTSQPGFDGDDECTITEYCWDFGDGIELTAITPIAEHTYQEAGNYTVTLTVCAPGIPPYVDPQYVGTNITDTTQHVKQVVPVGGYSFPIRGYPAKKPLALYISLVAILTSVFTMIKRKITEGQIDPADARVRLMEEKRVPKAKCLYNSFGRWSEEHREREEMKNKQKYNRNSKVELPKRYRKNKK